MNLEVSIFQRKCEADDRASPLFHLQELIVCRGLRDSDKYLCRRDACQASSLPPSPNNDISYNRQHAPPHSHRKRTNQFYTTGIRGLLPFSK